MPTVAGVLLFGTPMALRRLFPMMRIDYVRIAGTQWVQNPDHRFDTVEIRSPLIRAINRARAAILDDIPKAFSLPPGEVQAKEIPTLPDKVIREVVANAVMHRDYRVSGSILLIRYSNRLEVRNPGYSLKAPERLGEPGSQTRNPSIAMVLHELKLAETKGSGIRVIRDEMDARGLSPPLLESDRTGNQFICQLLFHHFLTHVFPNGFKAQVVATSREAAVRYKRWIDASLRLRLRQLKKANPRNVDLERLERMTTDVIFSGNHNDLPHLKKYSDRSKHEASIKSFKLAFGSEDEGVNGEAKSQRWTRRSNG